MNKSIYKKDDLINIIKFAQNDDLKAIEELIKRIQKEVWCIFSLLTNKKDDISDLTQEALLKIARSINTLNNIDKFKTWINQIITNVYYDYVRKKNNNTIEISEENFNKIKDKLGYEPGEKYLYSELEKLINIALMTLPKDLRITIILREYEGLSYNDIAKITKTTIGTVKSRISRARYKLQKELKEYI